MKDIGLGILEPYTVAIILITLVLAQVIFGYQIPLNTTDAIQLFIGLVLFTGYIYAARSLFRLPIAGIRAMIYLDISWSFIGDFPANEKKIFQRIARTLKRFLNLFQNVPLIIGYWFLYILDFAKDEGKPRGANNLFARYVIAIIDRIGLILITVLAVVPAYKGYFQSFAITGLVLMVIVFILKGNFSALLADSLGKPSNSDENEDVSLPEQNANDQNALKRNAMLKALQKQQLDARAATQPSNYSSVDTEVIDGKNTFG